MDFGEVLWEALRFLITAAVILAAAYLPILLLLRQHIARLQDPSNFLRYGVILRRFEALDSVAEIIGRYRDSNIYRYVTFKGTRYDFERVVPVPRLFQVGPKELFLEPGIVYVARA
jgi:hypothetical protein